MNERLELLLNPIWSNLIIRKYVNCSDAVATKIRAKAIDEFDGMIAVLPSKVKRDSVLKAIGLNVEDEIRRAKEILNVYN